ncbi:MAG: tripartite tricarboxylate transporter substrate binding protein [Thermodesulfobacteriota bacterium]
MRKRTLLVAIALLAVVFAPNAFGAEADYPSKPITALIGFSPGGGSDVALSMVRPGLEKVLKTTIVPVYKPGSGSDIGATELAMSKPDGYTIFLSCTPFIPINAYVRQTNYKVSDIQFVANVVSDWGLLAVKADSPYKTLGDIVKAAKEKPGTVTVGVSASPGDDWFAMQMFQESSNAKFNIVVFSGDGPSWQAAMAGHVAATANNLGIVYPQLKAGTLRALAIMSEKRSPYLPDVPTFKELGYDFTSFSARGISMPKGTPKAVVDKFAAAVKQVMDSEEFKANAEKTAFPAYYLGPEQYGAMMQKLDQAYRPLWDRYGKAAAGGK